MKVLPLINTALLLFLLYFVFTTRQQGNTAIQEEIKAERLSIVGPDGHLYMSISNPARQALATHNGKPIDTNETERDLPGIMFFNRTGDEVGGIYYDGTDSSSIQGITFDQMNNDQVMAIMKDEYYEGDEIKRWYGMYFRERSDSITRYQFIKNIQKELKTIEEEAEKKEKLAKYTRLLNEEIDTYRLFLGREENEEVGLFLFDSKGRERIKIYVDAEDRARLVVLDSLGNKKDLGEVLR
ncbi:MAG: hypothetical protein AAGF89_10515 [Bacteroidota bacterium]